MTLIHFLEFLEREGAQFITSELALRWAMEPKLVPLRSFGGAIQAAAKWSIAESG
jgi:hypothetical protein